MFEKYKKRKQIREVLSDIPPEAEGYDATKRPAVARWYHMAFLWAFRDKTVEEFPVIYTYRTAFGKNYFTPKKNRFVERAPSRAERRRLEREKRKGYQHVSARMIRKDQRDRLEEIVKS